MVHALEPLSKGEPVPTFECENFMTDQRCVNVTILSDSSLLFVDDAKSKNKKSYVRELDIKNELQRILPYSFRLRIHSGATTTEFVEEMQQLTGTLRDPTEDELSAAREGRRKRHPAQDPNGLAICICFWNGNDCAEL